MLQKKRILVTGATSGIGKAVAKECALQGADLILTGRTEEKLFNTELELGPYTSSIKIICTDLSSEEDLATLIEECGPVDGLVLCAGQVITMPVQFTTVSKVDELLRVNLNPNIHIIQQMLKKKLLHRGSSVVAITSVLGVTSYMPGNAAYGVGKAALEAWVRYCALEYAKKGIRFNTIQPGGIETPMVGQPSLSEEQIQADRAKVPMGRYGTPEEIADAVIFLLSDKATYITGSTLIVDGGRHLKY